MRLLLLTAAIVFPLSAAELPLPELPEIDQLYFHRHDSGNLERTEVLLERRLAASPEEGASLWRLARTLVRKGERAEDRLRKLKIYDQAREAGYRARDAAPEEPEAHYWYGVALGRRGQVKGLVSSAFMIQPIRRAMLRTLELEPGHARAHLVLGEMSRRLPRLMGGSKEAAVSELEEALRLQPELTAVHPKLAEAYLAVGRRDDALRTLRLVAAVEDPYDPAEFTENAADAAEMIRDLGGD